MGGLWELGQVGGRERMEEEEEVRMEQNDAARRNCKQQGSHSWGLSQCSDRPAQSRLINIVTGLCAFYRGILGLQILATEPIQEN